MALGGVYCSIKVIQRSLEVSLHKGVKIVDKSQTSLQGPSFCDVSDCLIELCRTWGGLHRFRVAADRDRRGVPNLFVVLEHSPAFGRGDDQGLVRVWSSWPCASNKTFAGLLFRLCYELDSKLTARRIEEEVQAAF